MEEKEVLDLRPLKIVVTGGTGFLGRHLVAALKERGCELVRSLNRSRNLENVEEACSAMTMADIVFHLAAKCGGIGANQAAPADFARDNLLMGLNVLEGCRYQGVKKLVMVGTLCAFPKDINHPIEPQDLWKGYPEPTNAPYGIAKRTLVEVSKAYHQQYGLTVVNAMPTNLYGPGDNFDRETSHVIPAMIRKFVEARDSEENEVACWGTGAPTRDFLYVTDAVEGLIRAAEMLDDPEPVLLGSGQEIGMQHLAGLIAETVGYRGRITWDPSKPDGQPRRVVSTRSQRERLGFMPSVDLPDGVRKTVEWYTRKAELCGAAR